MMTRTQQPDQSEKNGRIGRITDSVLRVLAASSVAICGSVFAYILKIESKLVAYDEFIAARYRWNTEHSDCHNRLNEVMRELDKTLNALITDVRVIQGNRFTSKDGEALLMELHKTWQEITNLSRDVKRLEQLVTNK